MRIHLQERRGAIAPMSAMMMVFLLIMAALAIDITYIGLTHMELQSAADSAALAGASQLVHPDILKGNTRDSALIDYAARTEATRICVLNKAGGKLLLMDSNSTNDPNGDLVLGRIENPNDQSSPFVAGATPYNSVFVRVRRDSTKNTPLNLFFGGVTGHKTRSMTATATASFALGVRGFKMNTDGVTNSLLLPFALDVNTWNNAMAGNGPDTWNYNPDTRAFTAGSDGVKEVKLYPSSTGAPGNFGTVDIGPANNSTNDIIRQILYGPNAADFDAIGGKLELGSNGSVTLQGDTGLSAAVKSALEQIRGHKRIIPLYEPPVVSNGNNAQFKVVAFVGITVLDVRLTGPTKYVTIQPTLVTDPGGYGSFSSSSITSTVVYPLSITR
jgi:Flp pilus assembly protein TadG